MEAQVLKEALQDVIRVEKLDRDRSCASGVTAIVSRQFLDTANRILHRPEHEQSLAGRVQLFESCILCQHWLAAGQVANAPIAKPAALGFDIHVLGDHKLGTGLLYLTYAQDSGWRRRSPCRLHQSDCLTRT